MNFHTYQTPEMNSAFSEPSEAYGLFDFQTLECWKAARDLRKEISAVVKEFPADEKYKLSDQLIRASRSVTANIAEGYGRFGYKDQVKFCVQARGSLTEIMDHLILASDEGLIAEAAVQNLQKQAIKCGGLLNGYIRFLRSRHEASKKS